MDPLKLHNTEMGNFAFPPKALQRLKENHLKIDPEIPPHITNGPNNLLH